MTDFDAVHVLNTVHGFISLAEAELLYKLAYEVPENGIIVEIGAYQGRSTICLGLGAEKNGAEVYSIDPHDEYTVGDTRYSITDNVRYHENIVKYELADTVRTINLPSHDVWLGWNWRNKPDLVWIDGKHDYDAVKLDFLHWTGKANVVALHDTAGFHVGVTKLLTEVIAAGEWKVSERVDAISVLVRAR